MSPTRQRPAGEHAGYRGWRGAHYRLCPVPGESWLRHGLPVRDRGLPGRGAGDGLEACRRAGALPGWFSWWLQQKIAQTRDHPS